ncbi:MAG: hypothetical protein H6Q89_3431 [Myxococcaceae bacterium]|nr:hypothetical protein [Myxococcaceae bacterium]
MSEEDFRRTHRLEVASRERRACPCGCRQRLPWLEGAITGPEGRHGFEAVLLHHQGQRRVLVGLQGPLLKAECAAWAFVASDGRTTYQPAGVLGPGLLTRIRPTVVTDEARLAAVFALLDVLLFFDRDAATHLAGPTEAMRQALDFSFRIPDALLAVPRGERQINENFAQLEGRRFVRALLPLPVLGGEEFRIGLWFEVAPEDFEAVAQKAPRQLSGTADNGFCIEGNPLAGVVGTLVLAPAQACPWVRGASAAWLEQAMLQVRSSDEHFALVREITDSYTQAQVARALARR